MKGDILKDFSTMTELALSMSNLDGTIDDGMAEQLQAHPGQKYGRHNAWEFNGLVWFEHGNFHEEVWKHHQPMKIISARSLLELMRTVNEEFGWK